MQRYLFPPNIRSFLHITTGNRVQPERKHRHQNDISRSVSVQFVWLPPYLDFRIFPVFMVWMKTADRQVAGAAATRPNRLVTSVRAWVANRTVWANHPKSHQASCSSTHGAAGDGERFVGESFASCHHTPYPLQGKVLVLTKHSAKATCTDRRSVHMYHFST